MSHVIGVIIIEGGSVSRCFKTPVIIANTGYRKGLSRRLSCGKIAALFLHIPTSRGDRPAPPPGFSAPRFSRNFSDLETPIYRAPLDIIPETSRVLYSRHLNPRCDRRRSGKLLVFFILIPVYASTARSEQRVSFISTPNWRLKGTRTRARPGPGTARREGRAEW
jgi:hypothetical protein